MTIQSIAQSVLSSGILPLNKQRELNHLMTRTQMTPEDLAVMAQLEEALLSGQVRLSN